MRCILLLHVLLLPVLLHAQDRNGTDTASDSLRWPLGQRLGKEIDRTEREYFNLFPDVSGFTRAEIEKGDGGVLVSLYKDSLYYAQIRLTARDASFFRWYLGAFEAITFRGGGSLSETLLALCSDPVLLPSLPKLERMGVLELVERKPVPEPVVQILTRDSVVHTGALLAIDAGQLYVWKADAPLLPDSISTQLLTIPLDSIHSLRYRSPVGFSMAFGVSFGITMGMLHKIAGRTVFDEIGPEDAGPYAIGLAFFSALASIPTSIVFGVLGGQTRLPRNLAFPADQQLRREAISEMRENAVTNALLPPELLAVLQTHKRGDSTQGPLGGEEHTVTPATSSPVSPWWAGFEYVVSLYGARTQVYNAGMGLTVARDFSLWRPDDRDAFLAIRPRVALGLSYVSAEFLLRTRFVGSLSLLCGLNWLRGETSLETARTGGGHGYFPPSTYHYNQLHRDTPWQETAWTIGIGMDNSSTHVELQYRRLLSPALSGTSHYVSYVGPEYRQISETEDLGLWSYSIVSLLLGFRL